MTTMTPEQAAAIKDAATRAGDAVYAATQAPMTDPVAWWTRIADAEDTYADALHLAAGLYFETDQFAYSAILSFSGHIQQKAHDDRRKAHTVASTVISRALPQLSTQVVTAPREGGAG